MAVTQWFTIELPDGETVDMTREQADALYNELRAALGVAQAPQAVVQAWPAVEEVSDSVEDIDRKLAAQQALAAAPRPNPVASYMTRTLGVGLK